MTRSGGVDRVAARHHGVTVGHGRGGVPDVVPRQPVVQLRDVVVEGLVARPVADVRGPSVASGVDTQPRQIFLQ